jgi:hypothetical protein
MAYLLLALESWRTIEATMALQAPQSVKVD